MCLCTNYFLRSHVRGGLVDETKLAHAAQHVLAPLGCTLRIGDRVVARRPLWHARQRRGLTQRELVELLAEVGFCSRRDAISALPEEDHIEIQREDFLL